MVVIAFVRESSHLLYESSQPFKAANGVSVGNASSDMFASVSELPKLNEVPRLATI
jgi:hypothetical protein